jgi:hypothetical protein
MSGSLLISEERHEFFAIRKIKCDKSASESIVKITDCGLHKFNVCIDFIQLPCGKFLGGRPI